jgi:hypothetical protein
VAKEESYFLQMNEQGGNPAGILAAWGGGVGHFPDYAVLFKSREVGFFLAKNPVDNCGSEKSRSEKWRSLDGLGAARQRFRTLFDHSPATGNDMWAF